MHLRRARLRALDDAPRRDRRAGRPRSAACAPRRGRARRDPRRGVVSASSSTRRLVERALRLVGRQLPLPQEVDVRAHRGQRRAQLVRRVGDEAPLRADRPLERREHLVEARREAAELVVAARPSTRSVRLPVAATLSAAAVRRRIGRSAAAATSAASAGRQRDADAADQEDPEADPVERAVGRLAATVAAIDGAAAVRRSRRRSTRAWTPLIVLVAEVAGSTAPAATVACRVGDRERRRLVRPTTSPSGRCSVYGDAPPNGPGRGPAGRSACLRLQRRASTWLAQLVLRDDPDRERRARDRDRDRDRGRAASAVAGSSRLLAEGVADAAHGLQQARLAVLFELAAEVADVDPERVRGRAEVVAPDALVDLRARQHLARVAQEELEQVELGARQLQAAVAARGLARRRVERDVGEAAARRRRRRCGAAAHARRARSSSTANGLTR